jgi:Tfp pilus assembly protein PilO
MNDTERVWLIILAMAGIVVLAYPLISALSARLRGRPDGGEHDALHAAHEAVLNELAQLRHEVGELGERVDFVERLQVKAKEAARLVAPSGP